MHLTRGPCHSSCSCLLPQQADCATGITRRAGPRALTAPAGTAPAADPAADPRGRGNFSPGHLGASLPKQELKLLGLSFHRLSSQGWHAAETVDAALPRSPCRNAEPHGDTRCRHCWCAPLPVLLRRLVRHVSNPNLLLLFKFQILAHSWVRKQPFNSFLSRATLQAVAQEPDLTTRLSTLTTPLVSILT